MATLGKSLVFVFLMVWFYDGLDVCPVEWNDFMPRTCNDVKQEIGVNPPAGRPIL